MQRPAVQTAANRVCYQKQLYSVPPLKACSRIGKHPTINETMYVTATGATVFCEDVEIVNAQALRIHEGWYLSSHLHVVCMQNTPKSFATRHVTGNDTFDSRQQEFHPPVGDGAQRGWVSRRAASDSRIVVSRVPHRPCSCATCFCSCAHVFRGFSSSIFADIQP
jgi:hypothetical protein